MMNARFKHIAQSKIFCHLVNYVILAFAALIGLETMLKTGIWLSIFPILDYSFLGFFTIEIIIRVLAEDHPGRFFVLFERKEVMRQGIARKEFVLTEHGFWNLFDFTLIALSFIGIFGQVLHPSFLQIGRLFRIFRILRLLEVSEHLKDVERRIMSIVPTVFSFAVLLLIMNYIYSIMGMFMFDERVFATCDFSSILNCFITLFQVMTLDNWSDVMHDITTNSPNIPPFIIQSYFVSFVVFTSIVAFNVFIAVMTSQVADQVEKDMETKVETSQAVDEAVHVQLRDDMKQVVLELQRVRAELNELRHKGSK
jgi:large-conductance mechanosensitive channel